MKLLVISHTRHYKNKDGALVGWGATVRELNALAPHFETVYHIGTMHPEEAPGSSLPYTQDNIVFVPMKPSGGKGLLKKLGVLTTIPSTISLVVKYLRKVDVFQLRTPTGVAVYLIPWMSLFSSKKGWYKYAGNWQQKNKPLGYAVQKWMLKKQLRTVTVNGVWSSEPSHIVGFENPCLTLSEWENSKSFSEPACRTGREKKLPANIDYCFVGSMHRAKGVDKIIAAWKQINSSKNGILHMVGGGGMYEELVADCIGESSIKFHGFLAKNEVHDIYKQCSYVVLPSDNEGFPKVIGEAMNYGCVPIVSDVSCIGQYVVHGENGFLIAQNTTQEIITKIRESMDLSEAAFKIICKKNHKVAKKFTYDHYVHRIQTELLT